MSCCTVGGLEPARDSVRLALAHYVSRVSPAVLSAPSRLARILLLPASLRTIPAWFVKMVFFSGVHVDRVMFSAPRVCQQLAVPL